MPFWILAIALTSDMARSDHIECFVREFEILVVTNNITDFEDLMSKVSQICWDYEVLRTRTDRLRLHFEKILADRKLDAKEGNETSRTDTGRLVKSSLLV